MKRLLYGLVAGVVLAGTFVVPASAAPSAAPRPADTLAELGGRAELIDILMEDHKGKGLSGNPRQGFGTPRNLSDGFPIVAERTYCDETAPAGQQVMVPPICVDPPDGPPPTYSLKIYPLLDVAYKFRLNNRSIYVLESENRALVVQKETDGWRFLPVFEKEGVVNYVDFRIDGLPAGFSLEVDDRFGQWYVLDNHGERVGGGMAPIASDDNGRVLTTTFSIRGDNVLRQTTKLGKTADGHKVKFPVVTDPWVVVDLDWFTLYVEVGVTADDVDVLYGILGDEDFQAFATALCAYTSEVPFLPLLCVYVMTKALDWVTEQLEIAASSGCGMVTTFEVGAAGGWGFIGDVYPYCEGPAGAPDGRSSVYGSDPGPRAG